MEIQILKNNIKSFLDIYNSETKLSVKVDALLALYRNLNYAREVLDKDEFIKEYLKLYEDVSEKLSSITSIKLHTKFLRGIKKISTMM